MKTKLILLLLIMVTVTSCYEQDEFLEQGQADIVINDQNRVVVNRLIDLGYKLSDVKELDDFFLVEGEILYSKDINDYPETTGGMPNLRHAHTNNFLYPTTLRITVRVDASIPASGTDNWRTAVQSAIDDWNGLANCGIFFVYTTSSSASITVKSDNNQLPNGTIASAGFPVNGYAFNTILINLDFNGNMNVSEAGKRYNMVHELGHAIGLRHTNWDTRGENSGPEGANLIPGTPIQDPNSVMNGGTALATWTGFSSFDQIAASYLYPFAALGVIESYWENDSYEMQDIYLETYTKADYVTSLNLPTNRTVKCQLWEQVWFNGQFLNSSNINLSKDLTANLNRHHLGTVVSNEWTYDYLGYPIGYGYQRGIAIRNLILE